MNDTGTAELVVHSVWLGDGWTPADLPHGWLVRVPTVYVVYDDEDVIRYIGSSIRVKSRLWAHRRAWWWPTPGYVQVMVLPDIDAMEGVERHLIEIFRPPGNRAGVTTPWFSRRPVAT